LRFWQPQRKTTISDENFLINANYEEKLVLQKRSRASPRAHSSALSHYHFSTPEIRLLIETDTRLCFVRSNNKASGKISWAPTETWTAKNNTAAAEETTE
jgi:hypothetical protein